MNNIDTARFEFSSDRVAEKTPHQLGAYIAGMEGNPEALENLAGFIEALQAYDRSQGAEFQSGFQEALERRTSVSPSL